MIVTIILGFVAAVALSYGVFIYVVSRKVSGL